VGDNSKIEKKWGRGRAVGWCRLGDSQASAGRDAFGERGTAESEQGFHRFATLGFGALFALAQDLFYSIVSPVYAMISIPRVSRVTNGGVTR